MAEQVTSDAAMEKATGQRSEQWFAVLDELAQDDHASRVVALQAKHPELSGWWAQTITVDYERARGIRVVGQSCAGDFQVSCSRTLPGDAEAAYVRAQEILPGIDWTEGAIGNVGGVDVEVRRADGQMLRWFWFDADGKSTVEVQFDDKGDRTSVTVRHHQLVSSQAREAYRERWKAALAAI